VEPLTDADFEALVATALPAYAVDTANDVPMLACFALIPVNARIDRPDLLA
jgi:hypothetical protein